MASETNSNRETLLEIQIKLEEVLKLTKYKDTEGHWTIGWGHNLDVAPTFEGEKIPDTISKELAQRILSHDIEIAVQGITKRWPRFPELSQARKDACINMVFQLGINGFMQFKALRAALIAKDHRGAYKAALDSKWARQTPDRAKRVATQFFTGKHYLTK